MDFFFLLPDGSYFLLPDGGRLIIGTDTPAPPEPTPTPSVAARASGGYADGKGKGRAKPQTLDEATRQQDEIRLRESKAQLKAILEDDAEVMQIIERFMEVQDKN